MGSRDRRGCRGGWVKRGCRGSRGCRSRRDCRGSEGKRCWKDMIRKCRNDRKEKIASLEKWKNGRKDHLNNIT